MTPNWHTTASNVPSGNGSCIASAGRHSTGRAVPIAEACSSMDGFRSVADDGDRRGKDGCETARHHARAGGDLEYAREAPRSQALRQVRGVRLEDQRNQSRVVDLGNRASERLVADGAAHASYFGSSRRKYLGGNPVRIRNTTGSRFWLSTLVVLRARYGDRDILGLISVERDSHARILERASIPRARPVVGRHVQLAIARQPRDHAIVRRPARIEGGDHQGRLARGLEETDQ